jgi:tetratricopeptide (TPR) repeat protein
VIPDEAEAGMLDRDARARLRTLSRDNAERVARHLVAAGMFLDSDPERAYEHAQAAHRRAGRVDIVREAVGLTAYATGRYAEALRELRTARRLSGQDAHRAIEADCERGLGRPERALALADAREVADLPLQERVEVAIVASGARLDLGEPDAALAALEAPHVRAVREPGLSERVAQAKAEVLVALGRGEEAERLLDEVGWREPHADGLEEVVVLDLVDEEADDLGETDSRDEPRTGDSDETGSMSP